MSESEIRMDRVEGAALVGVARMLFLEYADELGIDLEFQGFHGELASLPAPYVRPRGALYVAWRGKEAAGCAAFHPLDARVAEMKRLYVRPAQRGSGLGRALVGEIIRASRAAGFEELRLDTLPSMHAAQALYASLGFVTIPAYNARYLPGTRFYALALDG